MGLHKHSEASLRDISSSTSHSIFQSVRNRLKTRINHSKLSAAKMSVNGELSPCGEQNGHGSLDAAKGDPNAGHERSHGRSKSVGKQLELPLDPSQIFPPTVNSHSSPQSSPAYTTFSGRDGKGSASPTTSAASDQKAGTQAKEDAKPPGRRVSIALSNNESTTEAQFPNPLVSRQSIAERQIEYVRTRLCEAGHC